MTAVSEPGTDLAPFDPSTSAFPVLFQSTGEGSLAEIIEDNFGDDGLSAADLPRVKIPAGGGLAWDVPDEDPVRALEGVIVHKHPSRSMWFRKRDDDDADGPPDCASFDGKLGYGAFGVGSADNPSGACESCPMNVFGTADQGDGKKCKERMEIYLLTQDAVLPLHVGLPVTSATKPWRGYMTRLAAKGKSFSAVVTSLGLVRAKGASGDYSVIDPKKVRDLSPEEARAAKVYGATIRSSLEASQKARIESMLADAATAADAEPDA